MSEQNSSVSLGVLEYQIAGQFDQIERQLKDFESKIRTIKLKVELDESSLANITRKLQSVASRIKVDFDISAADGKIREVEARIHRAGRSAGMGGGYVPAGNAIVPAGYWGPNWTPGNVPYNALATGGVPPYVYTQNINTGGFGPQLALPGPAAAGIGAGFGAGVIPVTARRVPGTGGVMPATPALSASQGARGGFFGAPSGMSLYMNALFGGWEVAQAARAMDLGHTQASYAKSLLESTQIETRAALQASGGPFGSIIGLVADQFGAGPTSMAKTLSGMEAAESANEMTRNSGLTSAAVMRTSAALRMQGGHAEFARRYADSRNRWEKLKSDKEKEIADQEKLLLVEENYISNEYEQSPVGGEGGLSVVAAIKSRPKYDRSIINQRISALKTDVSSGRSVYSAERDSISRDEAEYSFQFANSARSIAAEGHAAMLHMSGRKEEAERTAKWSSLMSGVASMPMELRALGMANAFPQYYAFTRDQAEDRQRWEVGMFGDTESLRLSNMGMPQAAKLNKIRTDWDQARIGKSARELSYIDEYFGALIGSEDRNYKIDSQIALKTSGYGVSGINALLADKPGQAAAYGIAQSALGEIARFKAVGETDLAKNLADIGIGQLQLIEKRITESGRPEAASPFSTAGGGAWSGEDVGELRKTIQDLIQTIKDWMPALQA